MANDINERFRQNLLYYMELRGKKSIDLARGLGVSTSTVSDWTHGVKTPRADRAAAIAAFLGCGINDLLLAPGSSDIDSAIWSRHADTFRAFARLPEKDRVMIEEQIKRLSAYAAAVEDLNNGK